MSVDMDQAVQAYLNIRAERAQLAAEYEQKDAELASLLAEIDKVFLQVCNETNVTSLNTAHGTVIRNIKERFICNDWDGFRQFERENPDYDFREKRIHQGNIKLYMEENKSDGLPPGVNSMREFQITVRSKASK